MLKERSEIQNDSCIFKSRTVFKFNFFHFFCFNHEATLTNQCTSASLIGYVKDIFLHSQLTTWTGWTWTPTPIRRLFPTLVFRSSFRLGTYGAVAYSSNMNYSMLSYAKKSCVEEIRFVYFQLGDIRLSS